jgi:hypothetical protein
MPVVDGSGRQPVIAKACTKEAHRIQQKLDEELERLKRIVVSEQALMVVWMPGANKALSGEVQGEQIYIYEQDEVEALRVLRHEFIDLLVSQAIEPYRRMTNALIMIANQEAYGVKERVVDALASFFGGR